MINNYNVYMHIFPNQKKYIGITCRNPLKRWGHNGYGYRLQPKVYNAILKYGWDNIEHKILFIDLSKKEAEQKEIELIAKYKATNIRYGYNIENGGNTIGKHNRETIQKIREANIGKLVSDITKNKISNANKGRVITEETRQKLIEAGKKPKSEIGKQHIREAKLGEKNPMYNKPKSKETIKKYQLSRGTKKVIQYDLEGNIIRIWDSTYDASKELNICLKNIRRSCISKYNAGGYKWLYVD